MKKYLKALVLLSLLLAFCGVAIADTVQIGTGTTTTSYFPIHGLYNYSYSQQIFTQSQIGVSGEINKIRFYYSSGSVTSSYQWTIYMGHSNRTDFSTATDWESPANLTQVFSGDITNLMPAANNWLEITLDAPFFYNNTDNLIVAALESSPAYTSMTWGAFTSGTNTGIYYSEDANPIDLSALPTAKGRSATINRIQLVFPNSSAPLAPTLSEPANGAWALTDAILRWQATSGAGDANAYDVYFGLNSNPPLVSQNQVENYYEPTLEAGSTYYWKVVARNEIGDSPATDVYSFSTPGANNLVESFEDTAFPPLGWANPGTWSRSTSYKVHGSAAAYKYGSASAQYVLATPRLNIQVGSSLSFWGYTGTATGTLQIVYSDDGETWTQFGDNITYPAASTWVNHNIDLSTLAGNNYYLGFRTGLVAASHYIDMVIGPEIVPELPLPVTVSAPADASNLVSVTPTLAWNIATTGGIPSGYKVYLSSDNPPTRPIANVEDLYYTLDTTLDNNTTYYWQIVPWNSLGDAIDCPIWSFTTVPEGLVSIGDGAVTTLNLPLNPYYGYNYSQNIYKQSEINVPGQRIEKIAYYWNGLNSGNNSKAWTVYMGHTDLDVFASTSSWIPVGGLNEVFSGELSIPQSAGWIEITLTNPFIYNNSQNLVIAVLEVTPGNDGSTAKFLGTSTTGENRGLRIQSDSVVHNPASPGTGTLVAGIANILMQFGDMPETPILSVITETLDFGHVYQNEATAWQNVSIANTGAGILELRSGDFSVIGDHAAMFEYDASTLPFALAPGDSDVIPVRLIATTEGDLTATLRINYDGQNYDVDLMANALPLGTVIIGDGTVNNNLPVNTVYAYSYSQTIYPQSEINTANQRIEKIAYYWNGVASGETSNLWTVFMGHTDENDFATTSSWIPINQMTQVFSGELDIPATPGWIEVELDVPFIYTNSQNLVIAVDENQPGYLSSGFFFSTPHTGQYYSLRCQSDTVNPDPAFPPTGTRTAARPNIMMIFGDLPDDPQISVTPQTLDFGRVFQAVPTGWQNVRVANAGGGVLSLRASDVSLIGEHAGMFEIDTNNLPFALNPGFSGTIPVRLIASDEGELSATLRISYGAENYDVELVADAWPAGMVIIGDGTLSQRQPFGHWYGFERSAALYKANEVNLIGNLETISWDCATTSAADLPYKIWIGQTGDNALTSQSWDSLTQNLTMVKQGTHTFSTEGWHEFTLDTPYSYAGGNLIVAVESSIGGSGQSPYAYFRYTSSDAGTHMAWQTDNSPPTTNGTVNALRPNLMLHIAAPEEGAPAAPILVNPEHNATGVVASGFNLSWTADLENGGVPDYYAVFLSTDEETIFDDYYFETSNTYFDPVSEGDMEFGYEETWYWLIQAVNDYGEALAERAFAFTTEDDPRILSLPHSENFDTVATPNFPRAWTPLKTNNGSSLATSGTYSHTPSNSVYIYNQTLTETLRLVSPEIAVPLNTIKLSFYLRATSLANYSLKVGTVDSPNANATFTEMHTITPTVSAAFELHEVSFASYTGSDRYICFQHGTGATYQSFYLDTVLFEELMPADLAAIDIEGPSFGVAGTDFTFGISVKNNGTVAQNNYQVLLKSADDHSTLETMNVNEALDPDETVMHSLVWVPTDGGNYHVYGEVVLTGDGNLTNNTTSTKGVLVFDSSMTQVPVGDDASTSSGYYVPLNFYYKSSISDVLYFEDELRLESGNINALILKNTFVRTDAQDKHIKIYMANTETEDLTGGWLPADDFSLVFDGNVDFPAGINYIAIPLDTPFAYTGANLAVRYNRRLDTQFFSTSDKFFYTTTPEHPNRARYMQSDSAEYDPLDPGATAVGSTLSYVPNTTFVVQNAVLQQHAFLSGYVRDANNAPVAGATVTLTDERYSTITDGNGYYSFIFWEDHTVAISVSKIGYYPQSMDEIELIVGEVVEQDFVLQIIPRVAVSGSVLANDHPNGLEGAKVVLNGIENHTVFSAPNGVFSIPDVLGENTYTITITAAGYDGHSGTVIVETGPVNYGNITLIEKLWPATELVAVRDNGNAALSWEEAAEPQYFFWDFEEDNGGWVSGGYGDWEWGNTYPAGGTFNWTESDANCVPPTAAHSGTGLWGTKLYTNYSNSGAWNYLSKTVNLEGLENPQLRFYRWNNLYGDFDYYQVQVNGTMVFEEKVLNNAWAEKVVNLSAYTDQTVEIRFAVWATTVVAYAGLYIDDVYIGPPPAKELAERSRSLQGYDVYRFAEADEGVPANWTLLNSGLNATEYTDSGFANLPEGKYKWGVVANYSGNHGADAAVSNSLGIVSTAPDAIAVQVQGANIQLSWTPNPGAAAYKIYASDDPYGNFTYLGQSTVPSFLTPAAPAKKFFKVTAITEDEIRAGIERN